MKYKGYTGRLLNVNLSTKSTKVVPLSEKLAENYIGGVGIAAKIISDLIEPDMDPLEESNPACIYDRANHRNHSTLERQALYCLHLAFDRNMGRVLCRRYLGEENLKKRVSTELL